MNTYLRTAIGVLGGIVVSASIVTAQTAIPSSVIGAGGGRTSGGGFAIIGTIGQSVIGPTIGASLTAGQGFWYSYASSGISSVEERYLPGGGESTDLLQNSPNPFNDWTEFQVQIPKHGHVTLRIFDALGRLVRTVIDGDRDAGTLNVRMDAEGLVSGRYTAQLLAGTERRTITLVVVR